MTAIPLLRPLISILLTYASVRIVNLKHKSQRCIEVKYRGTMRALGSEGSPSARVRILSTV
ncbi:hypothetical protein E2C01_095635 [Portunus trituberculatus]|uniref:Uncharacterized protein n=1 Tax=Portunus trituberculatus TaxID=210409 RepID=A0A5B7K4Q5_PORTR|nr:hypothetical protein [Portunus trituberculatus]